MHRLCCNELGGSEASPNSAARPCRAGAFKRRARRRSAPAAPQAPLLIQVRRNSATRWLLAWLPGLALLRASEQALCFIEGELPGVGVELLAARAWCVWLELAWPEEHAHAFRPELIDGVLEWVSAGERGVHERQDDDRNREADGFREDAQGVGVADAEGAFADRVVSGWGDDHRVCVAGSGFAWRAVAVPDG